MDRWRGRVALVTGASSGIGAAICQALVGYGMTVVGCARSEDRIQKMATKLTGSFGRLIPIACDLSDEGDVLNMFSYIRSRLGRLHVCVNNAGFSSEAPLLTGTTRDWKDMLEVNVIALCTCTRESIQLMKDKHIEEGQIIHIGSIVGHNVTQILSGLNFYCGTKSMVRALTEGLRRELKEMELMRIRTACISPGLVDTEFLDRYAKDEERAKLYKGSMEPMRPEDVVEALVYILSTPPYVEVHDILIRPGDQPC